MSPKFLVTAGVCVGGVCVGGTVRSGWHRSIRHRSIRLSTNVEQLENRGYRPTANGVEKQLRMCLASHSYFENHEIVVQQNDANRAEPMNNGL
ncbi:MAG: hypothetical protein WCK15_22595 [Pirellula sp.]